MTAEAQAPEQTRVPLSQLMTPQAAGSIVPGYGSAIAFDLLQRQAKALSSSSLVPTAYRQWDIKYNNDGTIKSQVENLAAIPNTMIALNMATRMNADPIMVMQNLYIVEGRPSWSAQWVIAQINNCGRFEPLRFDMVEKGPLTTTQEYTEWKDGPNNRRIPERKTREVKADDVVCIAWTVPKGTKIPVGVVTLDDAKKAGLPILKGPRVSIEIAIKEGWYTKTGSKWQTMPELMLTYRAGAFFGRIYAPELLMGFPTQDEVEDTTPVHYLTPDANGVMHPSEPAATPAASPAPVSAESLRRRSTDNAQDAAPKPAAEGQAQEAKDAQGVAGMAGETPAATPAPSEAPAATPAPTSAEKPSVEQVADDMFGSVD